MLWAHGNNSREITEQLTVRLPWWGRQNAQHLQRVCRTWTGWKVHTVTNYMTIKMQNTFEVITVVKLKDSSNEVLCRLRDSIFRHMMMVLRPFEWSVICNSLQSIKS